MTNYSPFSLQLDPGQEANLLQVHVELNKLMEKALPLPHGLQQRIKTQLSDTLQAQPDWAAWAANVYTPRVLALQHPDNRILNLPWELALEEHAHLFLSKNTAAPVDAYTANNPLPLKILVMVSAPEDSTVRSRLSFEEEELHILRACAPLFETGQVQIHFTDDGSLADLRQKLHDNHYHILHFSGHGVYHEGQGYLELEDEYSMRRQQATASQFAAALAATPEHLPALVLLSSCQTAQGGQDANLSGVANELLKAGVPAVVAMGWSVLDTYANRFAGHFYGALANREPLHRAFRNALQLLRQTQDQELALRQEPGQASQWLIPQLYTRGAIEKVANLEKGEKKLRITPATFQMKPRAANYYFVGRRRDKKNILPALFDKCPIWLQGQGGLGKSSLAEHLVQRLLAHDSRAQPFVLDETSADILSLRSRLYDYFKKEHKRLTIEIDTQRYSEEAPKQVLWLLTDLAQVCTPVFIFDNLESFQNSEIDPEFAPEHRELQEMLETLAETQLGYLIFTGRYPAPARLAELSLPHLLKAVSFVDFWKKTEQLRLASLRQALQTHKIAQSAEGPLANYEDLVTLLYRTFGGNYRALEFFDEYFAQDAPKAALLLNDLSQFPELYAQETQETLQKMSANLVFKRLLALLDATARQTLGYLAHFRRPVLPLALSMQNAALNYAPALQSLLNLTLIELHLLEDDPELKVYYAPPLVKNLLAEAQFALPDFSDLRAGAYFEYINAEINKKDYTDLEEAFEHYATTRDVEALNRCGLLLSDGYYNANLFAKALHYALYTYEVLKSATQWNITNRAGLILQLFGNSDAALIFYEQNRIYLQQIGDRSGEGTTLNNISQIYDAKGDYDTALRYLEQSLAIQQQIGDRSGLCYTLHNIATIYLDQKKDGEKYMEYEGLAYQTALEIGDAYLIFGIGKYFGVVLCRSGSVEHGLHILETAYQIGLQSSYPDVEEVGALIQQYSQKGDQPKKKGWFGWW